ncbi:MAG: T9SS type A sorting domain-containing protein [Bacteroidota bacterium]
MRALLRCCAFLLPSLLLAQTDYGAYYGITCATQDTNVVFLPADAAILAGSAEVKTEFILDFTDDVPAEAEAAIRFAADVWGTYLISPVPIRVNVAWQDRGDRRLLASAGPATLFRGFVGAEPNTWYPVALAEAIAGQDLNDSGDSDINVNANSTANWYFGTDGNTPRNQIDLVSVMMHELGHGLGFLSSVDTLNTNQLAIGFGGRFIIYDIFLETGAGLPLTDPGVFTNPSSELLTAVTGNDLTFDAPLARRENNGAVVRLFAPPTFDVGSSVSHLNEATFRPGTENALMTPFLSSGESVHDPGPVTLGIFADMGWPLVFDLTSTQEAVRGELAVFPNPASNDITIRPEPGSQLRQLQLYGADGRLLRRQAVVPGLPAIQLSVADLRPGMYTLLLSGESGNWRSRVVVR